MHIFIRKFTKHPRIFTNSAVYVVARDVQQYTQDNTQSISIYKADFNVTEINATSTNIFKYCLYGWLRSLVYLSVWAHYAMMFIYLFTTDAVIQKTSSAFPLNWSPITVCPLIIMIQRARRTKYTKNGNLLLPVSVTRYDYCEHSFTYSYMLNVSVRPCRRQIK